MIQARFVLFCFIFCLGLVGTAQAEVVYQNNGVVMAGRIVERTQEYLVLKKGEGEAAVRVTIFFDDILRIESDEAHAARTPRLRPEMFVREGFQIKAASPLFAGPQPRKPDTAEKIRGLLESNRQLQLGEEDEASRLESLRQRREGVAWSSLREELLSEKFRRRPQRPQVTEEMKARYEKRLRYNAPGSGTISGVVSLPRSSRRRRGSLYVYLMKHVGDKRYFVEPNVRYVKIRAQDIRSQKVPYTIRDVGPATYKVFAEWDVAPPFIKERSSSARRRLAYLGDKGDYAGASAGPVVLAKDELKKGVNLNCRRLIETSAHYVPSGEKPNFAILDLYYQQLPFKGPKFFLVIKNKSDLFIDVLVLDITVNGEKALSYAIEFSFIEPGQEREFDVSGVYLRYQQKLRRGEVERVGGPLQFRVIWPPTGEVEFEKVLYVL